jgi:hypothetical protein
MLALEPVIVDRLRGALDAAWAVKGMTTDAGDRRVTAGPLASVMFGRATVPDVRGTAVQVQPGWMVLLVARRGPTTAALLDAAVADCVRALHNWSPGEVAGRGWTPLEMASAQAPDYVDDGIVGIELSFNTTAFFEGQP